MNNDEIYIEFKCDGCGRHDYNIKICSKCKQTFCISKCEGKVVSVQNNLICTSCYGENYK